jgi:type IV secretion system protein VirB6
MALACPAPGPEVPLVRALMGTVDCNVFTLTREGYGLLSRPDSAVMVVVTGLLTLYVAFIGYRMMLGRSPLRVGDMSVAAIKIGVVIALATNWAVYQTVVYDTLFKGPAQLAAMLMSAVQPANSAFRGDPFDGLQLAFDELSRSATTFAGRAGSQASPFVGGVGFGAFALNSSAFIMLVSSLGVVLAAKIVLALLLAMAPLVAALLLFEPTRGVVEGWLKACVAFAVAPLLATVFLALQLTMLEPSLILLARMRDEGRADLAPATAVLVLTLVFSAVLTGAGIAAAMIANGIRLPQRFDTPAAEGSNATNSTLVAARAGEVPARAAAIAAAAAAMERREAAGSRLVMAAVSSGSAAERRLSVGGDRSPPGVADHVHQPLGQSYRRAASPRHSAATARRDR